MSLVDYFIYPFLLILPILGLSLLLKKYGKLAWAHTHFTSVLLIILLLYCLAYVGQLKIGSSILFFSLSLCGLVLLAKEFIHYKLHGTYELKFWGEPSFCAPILLIFISWLKLKHAVFIGWDEFSHWGLALKSMVIYNKLPDLSSHIHYPDYPPGATLYNYLFMNNIHFHEGFAYLCQLSLILFLLAPLFDYKWKSFLPLIATTLLSYFAVEALGLGIRSLYTDHIMGILFGMTIVTYYSLLQKNKPLWPLVFPVAILPLIKLTGLSLSLVAITIFLFDQFIVKYFLTKGSSLATRNSTPRIATVFAFLIISIMSYLSWQNYISKNNLPSSVATHKFTTDNLLTEFNPTTANEISKKITKNFISYLIFQTITSTPQNGNIANWIFFKWISHPISGPSALGLLFIFFLLSLLLIKKFNQTDSKMRGYSLVILLTLGFIPFSASILIVYVLGMPIDGQNLNSIDRLHNSYLVAPLLLITFFCGLLYNFQKLKAPSYFIGALITMVLFTPNTKSLVFKDINVAYDATYYNLRTLVQNKVERIKSLLPESAKIYTIYQNTSGYPVNVIRYELYPRPYNGGGWSLGDPYGVDDVYSIKPSMEEFLNTLRPYDFVFLAHIDELFILTYGEAFPEIDTSHHILYKIIDKDHPQVRLISYP